MTDLSKDTKAGMKSSFQNHWKAILLLGFIFIGAGIACLISPNRVSMAMDRIVAVALLLTVIPLGMIVIRPGDQGHRIAVGAALLVTLAIGAFLFFFPESGVVIITLAITAYFVIHGIYKIALSFKLADTLDRGFATLGGFLNLMAAVLIFKFSEDTANNHEALAAGLGLVFSGFSWMRLALSHRSGKA